MFAQEVPPLYIETTRLVPPRAWLPKLVKLRDLMLTLGGSKIITVEAMCRRLVGDYVAGDVLNELFRLFPMGSREDGGVWKKDSYWDETFAISRYKMNKARAKLAPFIDAKVIKSGKAPCWHYWLKADAIIAGLAKLYGKSETFIEAIIFEEVEISQIEMQGIVKNRNANKASKSITTLNRKSFSLEEKDSTKQQTKGAVAVEEKIENLPPKNLLNFPEQANVREDSPNLQKLIRAGVWREAAERLAILPTRLIDEVITAAEVQQAAGKLRLSTGAYVAGTLQTQLGQKLQEYKRYLAHNPENQPTFSNFLYGLHEIDFSDWEDEEPAETPADYDPWELAQAEELVY
jgi:hypothetical protein